MATGNPTGVFTLVNGLLNQSFYSNHDSKEGAHDQPQKGKQQLSPSTPKMEQMMQRMMEWLHKLNSTGIVANQLHRACRDP